MKRIAVVILNYNGEKMLERFLPSVLDCSEHIADVVMADNCSTDNSVATVSRYYPDVRIIRLEKNFGFAEGYNRALKQVKADYYVLLNSDVEVTDFWLDPMFALMESESTIAACQPKLLDYKRKSYFEYAGAAGGYIDRYGYPYCRGRIFDTVEEDKGQYDTMCDIFWASGAALMIRSDDYWSAGGLDGRFFAHMEEIDLCWRLRARGRRVVSIPDSVVYHVGGATLNYHNPRKTYLNFRNNLLMLYKNLPQNEFLRVMSVRMILDYVAAFKFLLAGCVDDFKAVFKARTEFYKMRPLLKIDRMENLYRTKQPTQLQRTSFSILWRYYGKKIKTFDKLQAL